MKKVVVVPTFNESANIERLVEALYSQGLDDLHMLIVDDHSPDHTAEIARGLSRRYPTLSVLERVDSKGRGTAGIVGFEYAMRRGADAIVEMDADFSHPPHVLPALFAGLKDVDIMIASRLAPGSVDRRPSSRRSITKFANAYARVFLERSWHQSKVLDWTTGFRAYRRRVFETVQPYTLVSRGPSILQEVLFRALNQGLSAREIPFEMADRELGVSTFSRKVAIQSFMSIPCYRVLFGGKPEEFQVLGYAEESAGGENLRLRRTWGGR